LERALLRLRVALNIRHLEEKKKDMTRSKRSVAFWAMLFVAAVLPSSLLATKQLYTAGINSNGVTVGNAVISSNNGAVDYMARTFDRPGGVITSVWLTPTDFAWSIPLCTNGGPVEDDCTYNGTGNLDIEGAVTPSMLLAAGVSGRAFFTALQEGRLTIQLSDGSFGVFTRFM
jgi:hypothetical protein